MSADNSTTCLFSGCGKPLFVRGYCRGHIEQIRRGTPLRPLKYRELGRICNFSGCGGKHSGLGLCEGHRGQQKRGETLTPLYSRCRPKNTPPRIEYDEMPCPVPGLKGPCRIFRGNISKGRDGGYGAVGFNGKVVKVHRYVYERDVGPIPEGMKIDHRCRVRACCNADHLRYVTNQVNCTENVVDHPWQVMAARTHCKNGHEFTPENTVPLKTSNGRGCRACNREKQKRCSARKKLALSPLPQ